MGIDINVNHIALVETDHKGNPVDKKTYPLCTYGKDKDQAKALMGDTVKQIVQLSQETKKPIVREDLNFSKKKAALREESGKRARMLSSFHYSSFVENLESQAFRAGVSVFSVNPAFTSIIGRVKFAKRYGLTVHHGAALAIGRRHFTVSEVPSQSPICIVHKRHHVTFPLPDWNREEHVWRRWGKINREWKTVHAALFRKSPNPQKCASG